MIEKIKEHWLLITLILAFVSIQSVSLFASGDLWWDASVYIGMGKYMYSSGHSGFWESERPLVWPALIGFFWYLGLPEILWAKIITVLFSVGCIILTYLLGLRYFNKSTALLSSVFLSCTAIFFLYTSVLQTEIPATFFFLLALYYYEKQPFASGLLLGLSMMTRFFQIFLIIPFLLYLALKKRKQSLAYILGFGIPLFIFLIIHTFLYKNPVYPFILQAYMTQNTGWIFYQPWWYYFAEIFKENILSIASLIGIYAIFKQKYSETWIIPILFIIGFLPFLFEDHKEMRILISLLPFLALLSAYGIYSLFEKIHTKPLFIGVFSCLFMLWAWYTIPQLQVNSYDDHLDFFYTATLPEQGLWISNPSMIAYTDNAAQLLYFPLYNTERITALQQEVKDAQMILINSCDILPCPPTDTTCNDAHVAFIKSLQEQFDMKTDSYESCTYYMFT